jgi:hypothetical protein
MTELEKINKYRTDKLVEILRSYAIHQNEFDTINQMRLNNASVKDYAYALVDGLKYGNWPWVNHSTAKYKGVE